MQQRHRTLALALAGIATTSLLQCGGGKSQSSEVSFTVAPSQPIVITADTTVNGATLTNPWFKFYLTLTNSSTEPLTMVALSATITSPNQTDTTPWAIDPGSLTQTIDSGTSSTVSTTCNYTTFGTWQPNETRVFGLPGAGACAVPAVAFYVGSLKKPDDGSENYRYKVILKPIGWFGTETQPTTRFDQKITFFTQ